jgi:C-8 sterol isomerase
MTSSPVFDPEVLHQIARESIGPPIEQLLPPLIDRLQARYPGHIQDPGRWVMNNAGGAMGAMLVLHASLTEYVMIFGTPIGTEGHSGRYRADDWFMILEGEQWAFNPGELQRRVYRPGDIHHMPRGNAQGYRIPEHCWALEYARGFIPGMLPFGVADTIFSTLDVRTLAETFAIYTRCAVRELLQGKI